MSDYGKWQPIETLPDEYKDGRLVDLWIEGHRYPECRFQQGRWLLGNGAWSSKIQYPNYWMPLPLPPVEE